MKKTTDNISALVHVKNERKNSAVDPDLHGSGTVGLHIV